MPETAIVILAAGNSSRLGRPKQLLEFHGSTLIGHLADEAVGAGLGLVTVVSGAVDLTPVLGGRAVVIAVNARWREGMGSSIAAGMAAVAGHEAGKGRDAAIMRHEVNSVIIAGCDQPYVTAGLFRQLVTTRERTGKGIVACAYGDTGGIPVLFDRRYFGMLLTMTGQEGAKKILLSHREDLALVEFPQGGIDIDTEDDYARLSGG